MGGYGWMCWLGCGFGDVGMGLSARACLRRVAIGMGTWNTRLCVKPKACRDLPGSIETQPF